MSAYTNPQPSDPGHSRLKAALLARGASGAMLWFLLLTGAIVALTLVANRCGNDDDNSVAASGQSGDDGGSDGEGSDDSTDSSSSSDDSNANGSNDAVAEPEPTPTAAPEPTATPEPEPEPTPTPEPAGTPADLEADLDGGLAVLTGTVPDQATADRLLAAAESVLGAGNVVSELVIDPSVTEDGASLTLSGSTEEQTALAVQTALADALGIDADGVDLGGLDVVASVDVVEELNSLFAANPVQFASGSAEILDASVPVLDEVAAGLADAPGLALEIQGHTDSTGDETANLELSELRAQAVLDYLVNQGVAADRLTAMGFGETQLIADDATEEGRQTNRRIEFKPIS